MGFFTQFASQKIEDVKSGFIKLIVEFDPESATEAQIAELDEILTKITKQMVLAKNSWDKEQREAVEIKKNYDLRMGAAERLQTRLDAETDPEQKAKVETSLGKLIDELERMGSEVDREAREAEEAQQYYTELNDAVKTAAARLKEARSKMAEAKRRMDMAKIRAERAHEQEERAQVLSGIKKDAGHIGVAFDAMNKRAEEMETDAEVHKQKANLLSVPKETEDPLIAQALKEAAGEKPKGSLSDRLAALKK